MNRRGIPKKYGPSAWTKKAVAYWLKNEKYTSNTLCQKTFKTGFPYTTMKNQGEMDQFYIENCHPAIISQDVFDRVQALLQRKKVCVSKPVGYPLSRKIVCGNCGATLYRNVSRCGTATWICSRHMYQRQFEIVVNISQKFSPAYWCMADEVAATGTYYPHFPLCSVACPLFHPQKSFSNRALGESVWKCQREQGIHPQRGPMGGDRQGGNLCGRDV